MQFFLARNASFLYLCSAKPFAETIKEAKITKIDKMIERPKTLLDQLREMTLNVETEVKSRIFKVSSIRQAVTDLRKEGYDFIVTEKGCIDSCKVTRIR